MTEEESSKFTTKRRSIGSAGELKWGSDDGESWSDSVKSSEGVTVSDDGTISTGGGVPDGVVLKPESDGLQAFTGDTGGYEIGSTDPVFTGSLSLKTHDSDNSGYSIVSTTGLPEYPSVGKKHVFFIRIADGVDWDNRGANPTVSFGTNGDDGYRVSFNGTNIGESIELGLQGGDTIDSSDTGVLKLNTWLAVEIYHASNGDITADIYDASSETVDSYTDGDHIVTLSGTDTTHFTDGEYVNTGIGFLDSREVLVTYDAWRTN